MQDAVTQGNNRTARRPARGVNLRVRPKFGPVDLVLQLWRAKWLMIAVFLPIAALGVIAAATLLETKYNAHARVQISMDRQYVYEPLVGDAGRGASLEPEAVVQAEVERVWSPVILRRVVDKLGVSTLYPKLGAEIAAERDPTKKRKLIESAYKAVEAGFSAGSAPKSPVISIFFAHKDPDVAALTANTFVSEYVLYRNELAGDLGVAAFTDQLGRFNKSLETVEGNLTAFLLEHDIGDFDAERATIATLYANLQDEKFKVEAEIRDAEGRLSALNALQSTTPAEIDLYTETTGAQRLLDLQIEREDLLTRYRPDSRVVKEVDARIESMQALLSQQEGGLRRRGPNPAFQEIQSRLAETRSNLNASRARATELGRQMAEVGNRQRQLTELLPKYQRLVRDREVLSDSARTLAEREQTKLAEAGLSQLSEDAVSIIDHALPPIEGKSMKLPAALVAILFAGFTALVAGLIYMFSRKGLSSRVSAEKTIGLPVIAAIPKVKT